MSWTLMWICPIRRGAAASPATELLHDREDLAVPAFAQGRKAGVPGVPLLIAHDLLSFALEIREGIEGELVDERVEGTGHVRQEPGLLHRHPEPLEERTPVFPDREGLA